MLSPSLSLHSRRLTHRWPFLGGGSAPECLPCAGSWDGSGDRPVGDRTWDFRRGAHAAGSRPGRLAMPLPLVPFPCVGAGSAPWGVLTSAWRTAGSLGRGPRSPAERGMSATEGSHPALWWGRPLRIRRSPGLLPAACPGGFPPAGVA